MKSPKKIKLKNSVLVKEGKRKAMVYNVGADTILEFSDGMAKLMAFLDKHLLKNSSVTLEEIQKGFAKSSKRKKIPEKSIVDAVELLAKLSLLEGRKGSSRDQYKGGNKNSSTERAKGAAFSIRGMGKVMILGGAALFLAEGGARAANTYGDCLTAGYINNVPRTGYSCPPAQPYRCGIAPRNAQWVPEWSATWCCPNAGCS